MTAGTKLICAALLVALPGAQVENIAASGRCVSLAETPDARVTTKAQVAPGQAPLFTFRLLEGQARQRFANADLMLDDAGH